MDQLDPNFIPPSDVDPILAMVFLDAAYNMKNSDVSMDDNPLTEWSIMTPCPCLAISLCEDSCYIADCNTILNRLRKSVLPDLSFPNIDPADTLIHETYFDTWDEINIKRADPSSFNEAIDVSMTYLGWCTINCKNPFKLEEPFPVNSICYATGVLMDNKVVQVIIDTSAVRSLMTRKLFNSCPSLHTLVRDKPHIPYVVVGNGAKIYSEFIIPVPIRFENHWFEVYTVVTDVIGSDLFLIGVKSLKEIEARVCTHTNHVYFLNRSAFLYPIHKYVLPPKGWRTIKLKVSFPGRLGGMAIAKLYRNSNVPETVPIPIKNNYTYIDISNNNNNALTLNTNKHLGIIDVRSLGYFHISLEYFKRTLGQTYSFSAMYACQEAMNKVSESISQLYKPKKKGQSIDSYPWLDDNDPRHQQSDEEILHNTIDADYHKEK